MISPAAVCEAIASVRVNLSRETQTQADIEAELVRRFGDRVRREHSLSPGDRPDFMVEGVVVEVKIRGAQKRSIFRQLTRYAEHDAVTALILASGVSMGLPEAINGKPCYFVSLGRGWL